MIFAAGTTIQITGTLTAYADPASGDILDSYFPDTQLLALTGATLPDFSGFNDGVVPEPSTFGLAGLALPGLWTLRRRNQPNAN